MAYLNQNKNKKTGTSCLPQFKPIIMDLLRRKYGSEAGIRWERVQKLNQQYLEQEPYIGDKDNMMVDNLYQAFAMFALYEACDRQLTAQEITDFCDAYFNQMSKKKMGALKIDGNKILSKKWLRRLIYWVFGSYKKKADRFKGNKWNNTWGLELNPEQRSEGVSFHLCGCPLADFAKKHDMMEILPYMCNIDHKTAELMRLKLYRPRTVSAGYQKCEYWLIGDKSRFAEKFENVPDKNGLILSVRKQKSKLN